MKHVQTHQKNSTPTNTLANSNHALPFDQNLEDDIDHYSLYIQQQELSKGRTFSTKNLEKTLATLRQNIYPELIHQIEQVKESSVENTPANIMPKPSKPRFGLGGLIGVLMQNPLAGFGFLAIASASIMLATGMWLQKNRLEAQDVAVYLNAHQQHAYHYYGLLQLSKSKI